MNIYVVYDGAQVLCVTTLPRVVQEQLSVTRTVEVWRNDKRVKRMQNLQEFNRFINPRPTEEEEIGGSDYEW